MVRLPKSERTVENDVSNIRIRTPRGGFVPLEQIAQRSRGQAPTSITREDGIRSINVRADLAPGVPSSREVLTDVEQTLFPALKENILTRTCDLQGNNVISKKRWLHWDKTICWHSWRFMDCLPFRSKVTFSRSSSCPPFHLDLWVPLLVI